MRWQAGLKPVNNLLLGMSMIAAYLRPGRWAVYHLDLIFLLHVTARIRGSRPGVDQQSTALAKLI